MARISLLLSLAISSLFLSVYSLAPLTSLYPTTVSELQTLPFAKITEILNHKEKFAVKTPKIKAMFTLCKGYVKLLDSFYKYEKPITDGLGIAKKKYALTTKAILAVEASISSKVAHHARALEEDEGRQSKYDRYFQFFGSFLEGKQQGRELNEEKNGGKINNLYGEFTKYVSYLGGNDHGRRLLEDQAGVIAEAQGSGEFKGLFEGFFNINGGEKVQMDATGKMKVAGKDGFRSLKSRAHYKLFDSKEA